MAVATHKMRADNGQVNNARMAYKDSKGAHAKHMFLCDETGVVTAVSDDIGTPVFNATTSANFEFGDGADAGTLEAVRMGSNVNEPAALTTGSWTQPLDSDVVIMIAGRSVEDPSPEDVTVGDEANGFLTFAFGGRDNVQPDALMRVSPYFTLFTSRGATGAHWEENLATPYQSDMATRVVGQDYVFSGVKRGDYLEHYIDGAYDNTSEPIQNRNANMQTAWGNWQPSTGTQVGHSGYRHIDWAASYNDYLSLGAAELEDDSFRSDGKNQFIGAFHDGNVGTGTSRTDEYPQDFYFIYIGVFTNGAPPQAVIERAMSWMLTEFKAGNKVISPELISYT